jgi:hypothetical protein
LRALSNAGLLTLPINISEGESPDFILLAESGETTGVEVTRATTEDSQRQNTGMAKAHRWLQPHASARGGDAVTIANVSEAGWVGEEPEEEWCSLIIAALRKKTSMLPKYRPANCYDLLIYDDTPLPGVNRTRAVARLRDPIRELREAKAASFRTISVIASLDVLFDVGGHPRILPYIDWQSPGLEGADDFRRFAEDVEYGAQNAVDPVLPRGGKPRRLIYSMDEAGRIIKQTADGRRFEVRVAEDGEETIVAELPHA